MAKTQFATVAQEADPAQSDYAQFEIPGLRWLADERFELTGFKRTEVDWVAIHGILQHAGIPLDHVEMYVEQFARQVERRELARILADRMTRIG